VPDDQVTIDPQFQPPTPGDGQGRWLRLAGIGAVVAAAFILGWLLRSPTPAETEPTEAASTTALTGEATSTTRPRATTTTTSMTVVERVGLEVPLGEAVPGFADTITMVAWSEAGRLDLMRWRPSRTAPEPVELSRSEPGFAGLDASGNWYVALEPDGGILSLHRVRGAEPPWGEPVAVRVGSVAWHDTEQGQLAWMACPRSAEGSAFIYTLDVLDGAAEPVPVTSVDRSCRGDSQVWLADYWGDWGFVVAIEEEGEGLPVQILLAVDGIEIARTDPRAGAALIAGNRDGTTIWSTHGPSGSESFLLSADGQQRTRVPGMTGDRRLDDAVWSPDGGQCALIRELPNGGYALRIVETGTESVVTETVTEGEVWPRVWSTDGRFFVYGRRTGNWDYSEDVALVFLDTATGSTAAAPLSQRATIGSLALGEIRTSQPAPTAEQFTPVEWGIALDGAGPGAHFVSMIADARPLKPDQVEDVSGTLIWDETVVDLCNIEIRHVGDGFLHLGDIFGTNEGCGSNPTAMQDAFDEFGLPETACVAVRVGGLDHEYCAPLS
jgi:hypothetical protein